MDNKGFLPAPLCPHDKLGKKWEVLSQSTKRVPLRLTMEQQEIIRSNKLWWPETQPTAMKTEWLFIGKNKNELHHSFKGKISEAAKSGIAYSFLITGGKQRAMPHTYYSQAADINVDACQKVFATEIDCPEIFWLQLGGKEIFDKYGTRLAPDPSTQSAVRLWPQPCIIWTGEPHTVADHLAQLVFLKQAFAQNAGLSCIVGVSNWKYRCMRPFFAGPASKVKRAKNYKPEQDCRYIFWGSIPPEVARMRQAEGSQIKIAEDGFIRSLGLGLLGEAPLSITCDERYSYFDARGESRLERLLQTAHFDDALIDRAKKLRQKIISLRLSKYNLQQKNDQVLTNIGNKKKILVVGQVEDDQSIAFGSAAIKKNQDLLKTVRQAYPDALIAYKPHPDTLTGLRPGTIDEKIIAGNCDQYLMDHDIIDAIDWCDTLCTITSLAGFEAIIRQKHVVCYGQPFYSGWGLTDDIFPLARRKMKRSLDELVAATLILYPQYIHPPTQLPCPPEIVIDWLAQKRHEKPTLRRTLEQKLKRAKTYTLFWCGSVWQHRPRWQKTGKHN